MNNAEEEKFTWAPGFGGAVCVGRLHSSGREVRQNVIVEGVAEEISSGHRKQEAERELCLPGTNITPKGTSPVT